ncbi:MAG: radical SAM protein [Burkholderiales bacterium]|nr:radical SAM protein [Burkholderiales bacterium]
MKIGLDVLRKALHAARHPGVGNGALLPVLAWKGLPWLISPGGWAHPPITIYWNVNSVCNLHCKMCDVGTFNEDSNFYRNLRIDRKLHEIALERFKGVIDEVRESRPMIAINGTEPLMYKPLAPAVAYARDAGLHVAVTTGGYDLPQRVEELAAARLSRLNVSIDGAPALHNRIRGRKDVFERVSAGIVRFKEAVRRLGHEAEVLVCCTVMSLNYDRLEEFYDAVAPLPVDRINFTNMNFVSAEMARAHNLKWGKKYAATVNCLSEEVAPHLVDTAVLAEQFRRVKAKGGGRVALMPDFSKEELDRYYHRPMEFMGKVPCMSTWYIAQIMADGEVIPYTRCYHVPLGNINRQTFAEIWNGEQARAWRRDLRRHGRFPACTRCDMVY